MAEKWTVEPFVFEPTTDKGRLNLWVDATEELAEALKSVPGVSEVKLYGAERITVRINPRYPAEMVQAGCTKLLQELKPWEKA